MEAEEILQSKIGYIIALCLKYRVTRLRLFGCALRDDWDEQTSDFDFLADFQRPSELDAFDQFMGFICDLQDLLGRKVDVVDWGAAKNPIFRRPAEKQARELYAA